jgi:type I site-specific restriction endonuclease
MSESEKETRWKRVDPLLKAAGWTIVDFKEGLDFKKLTHHAVREYPSSAGGARSRTR